MQCRGDAEVIHCLDNTYNPNPPLYGYPLSITCNASDIEPMSQIFVGLTPFINSTINANDALGGIVNGLTQTYSLINTTMPLYVTCFLRELHGPQNPTNRDFYCHDTIQPKYIDLTLDKTLNTTNPQV